MFYYSNGDIDLIMSFISKMKNDCNGYK